MLEWGVTGKKLERFSRYYQGNSSKLSISRNQTEEIIEEKNLYAQLHVETGRESLYISPGAI